jgi:hypothetical protein
MKRNTKEMAVAIGIVVLLLSGCIGKVDGKYSLLV